MMPLFCAKMEFGKEQKMLARHELMPSASTPPDTLRMYLSPLTGSPEIIELSVISPVASMAVTRYTKATAISEEMLKSTPYLNGVGIWKPLKFWLAKSFMFTIPIKYERMKPISMPRNMELMRRYLLGMELNSRTHRSTIPAIIRLLNEPKLWSAIAALPPPQAITPTLMRLSPMSMTTV